ncbi:pentatricopeptide repeat-containing protein 2, mitochondrial-like [Frieseomelitta varia]|uniref:pentatricopeptide repeat-containing protein 2, mitochondrial-like n=1 Tax=Frieseomelitta varia TaxID=561572 RepID=UPI001CB69D8D|nr:pentatricopeptide repeat-containing protein 2, mitochondrial-like [Frieseomelitta varia]
MAASIRGLCKLNVSLTNNLLFKYNFINVGIRHLYTERDLGITLYENSRFMFRNQFMTIENTFREKMKEICRDNEGIIYTEDLKAMIHLAQAEGNDMQLVESMLEKYIHNVEEKKYGRYVFGPIIMRMFYYLNQPQYALNAFQNESLKESFDYRTAFRILMCLFYRNDMFAQMREIYDEVLERKGIDFIGSSSVLIYAACLKENTPESLEYALRHWKLQFDKLMPSVRCCTLVSMLALKHKKPEIALDILSTVKVDRVLSVRALKIMAYTHLGRYVQIIPVMKYALEQEVGVFRPHLFFADVLCELEEKIKETDTEENRQLLKLIEQAKKQDIIQTSCTLEEFLLRPMTMTNRTKQQFQDDRRPRNRYQFTNRQRFNNSEPNQNVERQNTRSELRSFL